MDDNSNRIRITQLIQRCVDGELSEGEQNQLIRELDVSADSSGWRALALEYLESQALSAALSDLVNSATTPNPSYVIPTSTVQAPHSRRSLKSLSLAASLMVGFLLGFGIDYPSLFGPGGVPETGATSRQYASEPFGNFTVGNIGSSADENANGAVLVSNSPSTGPTTLNSPPVMQLRMVRRGQHPRNGMLIPVYPANEVRDIRVDPQEFAVPDEVRRMLKEAGFAVDHQTRSYRVPFENGSELIVPSSSFSIRHASN